jgi:hypothetical protein
MVGDTEGRCLLKGEPMRLLVLVLVLASFALACSLAIEGRIGEPDHTPTRTNCP